MLDVPCFKQERKRSCSVACARMLLEYFGHSVSEPELISLTGGLRSFGTDTRELAKQIRKLGFSVECLRCGADPLGVATVALPSESVLDDFLSKAVPSILTVDFGLIGGNPPTDTPHSVVLVASNPSHFTILDPMQGRTRKILRKSLTESWCAFAPRASAHTLAILGRNSLAG